MQTSKFNKRDSSASPNTIFGLDRDKLAALPSNVRGEIIAVMSEADDALRSGDATRQAAATEKVRKLIDAMDGHHAEVVTEKFFLESLRPLRGDHAVVRRFAKRAGAGS